MRPLALLSLLVVATELIACCSDGSDLSDSGSASQVPSNAELSFDPNAPWDFVPILLERIVPPTFPSRNFAITDYGAKPGGDYDCGEAIRKAIAACAQAGGGRVVIPEGKFLTGPIHLMSEVELHLADGATLVFSDRIEDYLPSVLVRVGGIELYNYSPLIYARNCTNIAVTGAGTLDGNAGSWWEWARQETRQHFLPETAKTPVKSRQFGEPRFRIRPSFICFVNCRNILLDGFTIGSGPNWTIHPVYCENTTIRNVSIRTDGPNNDGIDPDSCRDVLIEDCTFDTADDCVVLKSGYNQDGWRVGRPTENVIVRRCRCDRGHGGLVIGSEMSGDVRNVYMEDCRFKGTDRIVRVKSRADRGGVVEHIYVRNCVASDLQQDVVILSMDYTADKSVIELTTPPVFRNMRFESIRCQGAPLAVRMHGIEESPIQGIVFSDIDISSKHGVEASRVERITFNNVRIRTQNSPTYSLTDAVDVSVRGGLPEDATSVFMVVNGEESNGISILPSSMSDTKPVVRYDHGAGPYAVEVK